MVSASTGMPPSPRREENSPSFITPSPTSRVLGVMDDERVEIARIGHGAAHDERVGDRAGAVGEGDRTGLLQEAELGHLASGELLGDRRHGMNVDDAGVAGAAQQEVDDGGIVHDRIGRRLADDGGDAARRSRGRA